MATDEYGSYILALLGFPSSGLGSRNADTPAISQSSTKKDLRFRLVCLDIRLAAVASSMDGMIITSKIDRDGLDVWTANFYVEASVKN